MLTSLVWTAVTAITLLAAVGDTAPTRFTQFKRDDSLKWNFGSEKVRGVNLGGWFVLEPWITPSLFEEWADGNGAVDEYTYTQTLGKNEAYNRLSNHWNTWITQDDFSQIASHGLNFVRIPIGYWSVIPNDGDPYVQGAYDVLGEALGWAQSAGLQVLIDLHGAPLSQNGFDNSGRRGSVGWQQGNSINQTLNVLNKIRDDHASHPAVAAIELINEPLGSSLNVGEIRQFYMDGWGNLKGSNVMVVFHDAFEGVNSWNNFGSGMWSLMEDTHHYEVFDSGSLSMDPAAHVSAACSFGGQMSSNNLYTIAGEWTGAQTDCARWLNGLGLGARYDGTYPGSSAIGSCDGKYNGTVAGLSNQDKDNIGSFVEAQMDAFEKAEGWIFWTWKTESAPEWHMQDLLAGGVFPSPVTNRNHPGQCG